MRCVLRELKAEYSEIDYAVVLAYMPGMKEEYDDLSDTLLDYRSKLRSENGMNGILNLPETKGERWTMKQKRWNFV